MPNIAITSYCNLHCPYCFANTMINTQEIKNITMTQFKRILNWLDDSMPEHEKIGIIGGEPTLHPQINEILSLTSQYCEKLKSHGVLFTNGIYMDKIMYDLPHNFSILININTPSAMTLEQYKNLQKNLAQIYKMGWFLPNENSKGQIANLGCNLCPQIDNYGFFWENVDICNCKIVRVSVTAPTDNKFLKDKDLYYSSMKNKFLEFIKQARIREIQVSLDCNQIPLCYFTNQEILSIKNVAKYKKSLLCKPVIDITPDFKASSCFGAYDTVDCSNFESFINLQNYLLYKKIVPLTLKNNQGKCKTCEKHINLVCQGGCLAFANVD